MVEITIPAPYGDPNAANRQQSSYAGVSTADLFALSRALENVPANLAIMATIGRVRAEWERRPREDREQVLQASGFQFNLT